MKILIVTVGTRGDVQPFVALAVGLNQFGHEVTICTCYRFQSFVTGQGVAFEPLDEGLLEFLESDFGRAIISDLTSVAGAIKTIPRVLKQIRPIHHRMVADAWQATESVRPDLIIYHPKMFCVPAFAAVRKTPAVLAMLCPMHVPTSETPFFGLPRLPLGGLYNRSTYRLAHVMTKLGSRAFLRTWRAKHDPSGLSSSSGPTRISKRLPIPVIHGYSEAICPRPKDWPENASVTGYWFLPEPVENSARKEPPNDLVTFLASGPRPVYVGFGSMAGTDPSATTELVLSAVAQAKVRAIIATGWGGIIRKTELPEHVHAVDSVSHQWLFPQVSATVHHGGAGTTAASLRAGCPTVVCPFALDQPFWGRRVHELGAGPKPLPQKQLTARKLADAVQQATTDDSFRAASQRIRASIRGEDGVRSAYRRIEEAVKAHASERAKDR